MQSVMFTFKSDVAPDQQDAILEEIEAWNEVTKASRLKEDAKNAVVLRMAYANVADNSGAQQVVERLSEMPEIESASLPAKRKLV